MDSASEPTTVNTIGEALASASVVLGLEAKTAKRVCEEIAAVVARRQPVDEGMLFRALWRREQCGSTAVGHGIAIPHARIPGIVDPILLFARTEQPVAFGALDDEPVSAFFVILVPEHAHEEHLRILAVVSEMFSERAFREQLAAAAEPAAIQRLFGDRASARIPLNGSAAT
jgi:nitrogen PTS system EIIA component